MSRFISRYLIRSLTAAAAALCAGSLAQAADRVALVIGNSAYQNQKALANPVNDAHDMSEMLRTLGFEVIEATDIDRAAFDRKIRDFRDKLDNSTLALLFYAGHGMEVGGKNFIVPVDAKIERESDVELDAINLDLILRQMRGDGRASIVILDACRDNPYVHAIAKTKPAAGRDVETAYGGLAEIKKTAGFSIIFSTDPGNVASDGKGRNSPFTAALLRIAPTPGLSTGDMVVRVRADVLNATHTQMPWESSQLLDVVYLAGPAIAAPPTQQVALTTGTAPDRKLSPANDVLAPALPPVPPPGTAAPQTQAMIRVAPPPADDFGAFCDLYATDKEDPLRAPNAVDVRNVDSENAIPACEKAVAKSPSTLRYANQLGRSYLQASRYADANRVFRTAAETGAAYAIGEMGYLNYRGWGGVPKNYPAARRWFEKAAALGVPVAMSNLGYMFMRGIGGPKDIDRGLNWLNRGVALDNDDAINTLAGFYRDGLGVPKDLAKARTLFEKSVALEHPAGMLSLAYMAQAGLAGPKNFEEARRLIELAAAHNHAPAMAELGHLYRRGDAGFPRDLDLARDWYKRAAKLNSDDGYLGLGALYLFGEGVTKDIEKARENIEKAASYDNPAALRWLAQLHQDGSFGKADREEARKWLQRAVDLDDDEARATLAGLDRPETPGEACDRLAALETDPLRPTTLKFVASPDPQKAIPACEAAVAASPATIRYLNQLGNAHLQAEHYPEARRVFEKAAASKAAYATMWIGNMFDRGLGGDKNPKLASEWYEKAAKLGSVDGMYNLAVAYHDGSGVVASPDKSKYWYEQAAAKGFGLAMTQMGTIYYEGRGIGRDYVAARQWYEKAAAKGQAAAKNNLGVIYSSGLGIKADAQIARQWYAEAAEAGNTQAMESLAKLYISGEGGAKEPVKARGLLQQAAESDAVFAMNTLAQAHLSGAFGEVDTAEAHKWLQKAASLGDATARRALSEPIASGSSAASQGDICDGAAGRSEDPLHAVDIAPPARVDSAKAIPACEAAMASAPERLRYADQLGIAYVSADRNFDAMRVFRAAAEKGSSFAAIWVGNIFDRGLGVPKDPEQAATWFAKAAAKGDATAITNLGLHHIELYRAGKDKDKNANAARKWLEKSAALGEAQAMLELSFMYRDAIGVPADPAKQVEWLKKAADFGNGQALNDLGMLALQGTGVPKSEIDARALFERAVAANDGRYEVNLAHMCLFGLGGAVDKPRARTLLETAAGKQDVSAVVYLAQALNAGSFGKKEVEESRRLLRLAVDLGSTKAKDLLAAMK